MTGGEDRRTASSSSSLALVVRSSFSWALPMTSICCMAARRALHSHFAWGAVGGLLGLLGADSALRLRRCSFCRGRECFSETDWIRLGGMRCQDI